MKVLCFLVGFFNQSVYKRLWSQCLISIGLACCVFVVAMRAKGDFLSSAWQPMWDQSRSHQRNVEKKISCVFYRQMSFDVIRL